MADCPFAPLWLAPLWLVAKRYRASSSASVRAKALRTGGRWPANVFAATISNNEARAEPFLSLVRCHVLQ